MTAKPSETPRTDAIGKAIELLKSHAESMRSSCFGCAPGEEEHDWACDDCGENCSAKLDFEEMRKCISELTAAQAEIEALRRDAERVLYKQCSKHTGMAFTFKAETVSYTKIVCPNCIDSAKEQA
jgi:hypothetical protein